MEEPIYQIVSDLETHLIRNPNSETPISESTLLNLQTLLDYTLTTKDPIGIDRLFEGLSAKNVSASSLGDVIASVMESNSTRLAILGANVFLSLLLSPNAPLLTLFTPLSFHSLMRAIRRFFKNPGQNSGQCPIRKKKGRGGGGGRGGVSRIRAQRIDEDESEIESGESQQLDVRVLFYVLERLEMVLSLIHLDRFPECLKSLVQTVAEIPVMALESYKNSESYDRLCGFCTQLLCEMLKADHGNQLTNAAEVLKSLSPSILLLKSQAHAFGMRFVIEDIIRMAEDSDDIKKAMVRFSRYLVRIAPEKAEPRAAAVESIIQIVKAVECIDQVEFADSVVQMAHGKHHLRLLALDLFLAMMVSSEDPLGIDSENGVENSWGMRCLESLVSRFLDTTAAIRARALTNLAHLVGFFTKSDRTRVILKQILVFEHRDHFWQLGPIKELLRYRCIDDKAAVRKAALLLTSKLTGLLDGTIDDGLLKTMGKACSDPLVSIRKAAISALSEVFRTFWDDNVTKEWLHAVPRLIIDNESSIQEECENLFLELVLDRISRAGSTSSPRRCDFHESHGRKKIVEKEEDLLFPEGVLCLLREISNRKITPWVQKICADLGKKKRLKPKIAIALQNIIKTSESLWLSQSKPIERWTGPAGAWFLLSEVSPFLSKSVDWQFLLHHWRLLDKHKEGGNEFNCSVQQEVDDVDGIESSSAAWAGDRVFLLQTITRVSVELPCESAAELAYNLLQRIGDFNMHLAEVNAHVKALETLCKRNAANPEEVDFLFQKWVYDLLPKASNILKEYMSNDLEQDKNSGYLTPPSQSMKSQRAAKTMSKLLSQTISAVFTIGSIVVIYPKVDLNGVVPMLHKIITSGHSLPNFDNLPGPVVSIKETEPELYLQAWIAMGKICLADEKLAKCYIPLFVKELENSDSAEIRNNVVAAMTDFCVRYTALVDSYISKITNCLLDPCEVVRRQTFILLSRLLQRDYVKWRGVIFHRFLLTLVDESEKIRHLADFLFASVLKAKAPLLAYNSFVETIYVLNGVHAVHSSSLNSSNQSRKFSICGNDERSRSDRMRIYTTLLKQMAPEHLLATFAKVCADILTSASVGILKVEDAAGFSILQDALEILSCKEIKLPSNRGTSSDSAEMDEDAGDTGGAAGKGRIVSQAVKKNLIQNSIPIFIELKRVLQKKNSSLLGSLMECLRVLLKDYKNEIDDLFVSDKQLQKEIMFDMQKYEAVKGKANAANDVATLQQSEILRSPGDPKMNGSALRKKLNGTRATTSKAASEVASAVADVEARSIIKEANRSLMTPPMGAMDAANLVASKKKSAMIESVRKKYTFESDEDE